MKKRTIQKVAVLGSGVMGSRIALHFANIGVRVLLLDMLPKDLDENASLTQRNKLVNDSLQAAIKSTPAPHYHNGVLSRIETGNFSDNLKDIQQADWIIEAIVEKADIKKQLYEEVEKYRKPGTLITSNTSGIPMKILVEGRSDDFQQHFCGTHFFNPPRYLRLLEIIPAPNTKPEIIEFLMHYGDVFLGKETVLCKDTPAFIANRIGVYGILSMLHTVEKMGLTIGEVDKLTGPLIGRAKSATFRTTDIVGLDTMVNVSKNLYASLLEDESRETFRLPVMVEKLYSQNRWGDKTGEGFFKKIKNEQGESVILELDLNTYEYKESPKIKIDLLEKTKDIDDLKKRLQFIFQSDGKYADFLKTTHYDLFRYCTFRIPEITDELYRIDQAICAGFNWELGPFQIWDVLGVADTLQKMEQFQQKPAPWVYEMLQNGYQSFYTTQNGQLCFYDILLKKYRPIESKKELIILDNFRKDKKVWSNAGATLLDIGDGILNLEFHSKMNTLGAEVIQGINTAISIAEKDFRGLVIGHENAQTFSAGANLATLFMYAGDQEWDEINLMIAQFQNTMMRVRYSAVPVVVAPSGMALGGGCELTLHADCVQAHAELYIGLVEFGVGLIPAGGGSKEMTLRASDAYREGDPEFNVLQTYFMNIATAKVSTSAHEAKQMNILRGHDKITINRSRLLTEAKKTAIELAEAGYTMPMPRKDIKVQGRAGIANFEAGITSMLYGNYISEHDAKIARKLSYVMNGGDLSAPTFVSEQYLLDLEREAFLSLCGEPKTLERIHSILFKGKTLRN
ncbi:MAG: 3-hydroxyacyl-CoA dehydrogenase/enoyl-CoA hydratase family protein [Cytophagales bacterium]|nr:3-hydroxyacyl-CoA dehydrogenase/enoyl-CoA hydratase family protein [Cytophagales bacterium]MDW8384529.1 3-hydroxyacyl-CoA dehydrogenase/enoyl-CoA hydratase family protein [Flammeovirgaceae bacterium]